MNSYVKPILAGLLLASVSGAAIAQTTPATRPCQPGEREIGGVCQPLTGTPDRPSTNAVQPDQSNTTGSTGGPTTGNQNTGGSGGQGGSSGGPSTGGQNTGGSGGSGGSGGGSTGSGG